MTEFFNRYRNLFTASTPEPITQWRSEQKNYHPFPDRKVTAQPQYQSDYSIHLKMPYLGRSPALDEFDRVIAPKLGRDFPEQRFRRLKTQIEEIPMRARSPFSPDQYQTIAKFPINYNSTPQAAPRERLFTQPAAIYQSRASQGGQGFDLNRNIEELEKLYMGSRFSKYNIGDDRSIQKISRIRLDQQPRMDSSRRKNGNIAEAKKSLYAKKWDVKVLPRQNKIKSKQAYYQDQDFNPEVRLNPPYSINDPYRQYRR